MRWAWLLLALVAAGGLLFWLGAKGHSPPRPPSSPKGPLPDHAEFLGSAGCLPCHAKERAASLSVAHARALQPPAAAAGAFDGKPTDEATPSREGNALIVNVDMRDGRAPGNHRVTHVVPGRAEEFYLFTDARGAWRLMPIAWNVGRKAWDRTDAVYEAVTGDETPGDARQIVFNRGCGACHATRFDPGFRPEPGGAESFDSTSVEPGVGCEACHGPGSVHALWHGQKREGAYDAPAKLKKGGSGGCLPCHYAGEFLFALPDDPAEAFGDVAVSRNFDGRGFLPDGSLSADRHAGTTFVQSACFRGGATCLSCHAMHGEATQGDALCTGCHDGFARTEHTHHEDVRCVDCHMPRLLDAPLDSLRDHSLRSPEPLLTLRFEVPNACNACHKDKTVAWAREAKEKWYGPADEQRVAEVATVVALREDPAGVPAERLAGILRGPRSPLFSRLTALRSLPQGHPAVREALAAAEVDLVQVACEMLAERPDPLAAQALIDLLRHPARTVRIEAGYALARAGWRAVEPRPELRDDVRAMFFRQYPATPLLVRAAWIHEALGAADEMALFLPTIAQRAPADAAPLIERRGRDLAEAGQHAQALAAYDDARRIYGDTSPPLLDIDAADSAAAKGDAVAAAAMWRRVVEHALPASVEHAIARTRLMGEEGRGEEGRALLDPIAARLAEDPLGGELLLRVRWSQKALAKG